MEHIYWYSWNKKNISVIVVFDDIYFLDSLVHIYTLLNEWMMMTTVIIILLLLHLYRKAMIVICSIMNNFTVVIELNII